MELPIDLVHVQKVLRRHGVTFAFVFGSQAEGRAREDSDVDLAVWGGDHLDDWRLRGELPAGVDLVDLRRAPEGLAGRVALLGQIVLDDDPVQRIRWQAATRKRYLDEVFRREAFRRDFVRAHG